ncbi:MAG: thioredoxin family protein [bacterium]|nr:thioredoxin family protein [bacterium]
MSALPDGLIAVVKRDCPTCTLVEPVLQQIGGQNGSLTVYTQDDPSFPEGVANVIDDTSLEHSYRFQIETVPTLLRVENGGEVERAIGWHRGEWEALSGVSGLGADLPETRPGCGSKSVEPGVVEELAVRFGGAKLAARRVEVGSLEDEVEACFERGWTDGLPVVPPTEVRVLRMLKGTSRAPDEIVGIVPPNYNECTVEKVAINAVMAGCKPEYMPVVLAAIEAVLMEDFGMHGLLATTFFAGPMVVVNGPIAREIGMNARVNVLGQGNRANATIGRTVQLVIRNVGGGVPGGVDRAMQGNPGKYTFCFAEREEDSPWESLAVERGFAEGVSTVSLFAASGVTPIQDQASREPEGLCRSIAACLKAVGHPKHANNPGPVLVISPEHTRRFEDAGWSKAQFREVLDRYLEIPVEELVSGAGEIAEGISEKRMEGQKTLPKFRPGTLHVVRAGGDAGLFSSIISGWGGSKSVTREIVK